MTVDNRATQQMRIYAAERAAMQRRFSWLTLANLEKSLLVFSLFMLQFNPPPPFPDLPATAYRFLGIGLALLTLYRFIPQMIAVLVSNLQFTALLILCGAGILWSIAPDNSVEPVMILYMTSFIGIYIAMRYSLEEQLSIVMWLGVVMIVVSFVMAFQFQGQGGLHVGGPHDGAWRAGFPHKNQFATLLTLTTLPILLLGQRWGRWRWMLAIPIAVAVWNSTSATGLVALVAMLSIIPILRLMRLRHRWLVGALLIMLPIIVFLLLGLLFNSDAVLEALGRNATLTGRTTIWNVSMDLAAQRPWLGWGMWGAFSPASPIHDALTWAPAHAHNSWVDTLLTVGVIGTMLLIFTLAMAIWQGVLYAYRKNTWEALFPLVFMIHLNIVSLTTASLLVRFDLAWILFVGIVYGLAIANQPMAKDGFRRRFPVGQEQRMALLVPATATKPRKFVGNRGL